MAGSTRIKGKALGLTIGTVDYWADLSNVVLDNEEAEDDVTTFADAAEGGGARQYFITANGITSTDVESFWRHAWEHAGESGIAYVFAPHGNAVPTAAQPHFIGTLTLGPRPPIGVEAATTSTFEVRMECDGVPVLDDGTTGP